MKFRQIGILLIVGGFLAGQFLGLLTQKGAYQVMEMAAGAHDPVQTAKAAIRALNFQIGGHVVSLFGLVIYFYGVLTSRGGRNTGIVPV